MMILSQTPKRTIKFNAKQLIYVWLTTVINKEHYFSDCLLRAQLLDSSCFIINVFFLLACSSTLFIFLVFQSTVIVFSTSESVC